MCFGNKYLLTGPITVSVWRLSLHWNLNRCTYTVALVGRTQMSADNTDMNTHTHTHEESITGPRQSAVFSLLYSDSNWLKPIIRVKGCLFVFLRSASYCFNVGSEREGSVAHKRELECRSHPSYFQFFPHDERESPGVFISQSTGPPRSLPPSPSLSVPLSSSHNCRAPLWVHIEKCVLRDVCQCYWFVLRRGGQRG